MSFLVTTFTGVELPAAFEQGQAKVSKIRYVNVYQSEDAGLLFPHTVKRKEHLISSISLKSWRYVFISWCQPYSVIIFINLFWYVTLHCKFSTQIYVCYTRNLPRSLHRLRYKMKELFYSPWHSVFMFDFLIFIHRH